jgi:arginine decarboxylase
LNFNIQAGVIRRRFAHRSARDRSALSRFLGEGAPQDLMEKSPDTRAELLGHALARTRPKLDPYLMTEISLERGRLGRRQLPPDLPLAGGHPGCI